MFVYSRVSQLCPFLFAPYAALLYSCQANSERGNPGLISLFAFLFQVLTGKVIEANWGGPQYPNASTATDPIANYSLNCGNVRTSKYGQDIL